MIRWQLTTGVALVSGLNPNPTTRADDSHASPVLAPNPEGKGRPRFRFLPLACQAQVRFFAYHRIKPRAPPLVRGPVNSLEF